MIGKLVKFTGIDVKDGKFPFSVKRAINVPEFIWDSDTGNKFKLLRLKEEDYGGGYCREVGIYKCVKLADWSLENGDNK